jgi:hypothetical protein
MKANDLHNFRFELKGSGCVRVTYFTDKRGDFWRAYIDDMDIIDATKNAEWAKAKDIEWLRYIVIRQGAHYSYNGKRLSK